MITTHNQNTEWCTRYKQRYSESVLFDSPWWFCKEYERLSMSMAKICCNTVQQTVPGEESSIKIERLNKTTWKSKYMTDCSPWLTIAASFHLTHPVEGICDQVGESPIQVHGGQTALVPVPGCDQFGQIAVHVLDHATDVQLSCTK